MNQRIVGDELRSIVSSAIWLEDDILQLMKVMQGVEGPRELEWLLPAIRSSAQDLLKHSQVAQAGFHRDPDPLPEPPSRRARVLCTNCTWPVVWDSKAGLWVHADSTPFCSVPAGPLADPPRELTHEEFRERIRQGFSNAKKART